MSLTRQLAWNSGVQVAGKIASTALGFVVIAIVARALGTTGSGHYYTALAYLQVFGVLADLGLYIVLLKKLSEDPDNADAWSSAAFTIRLITALGLVIVAPAVALFTNYAHDIKVGIAIGALSTFAIVMNQVLVGIFQRSLQMGKVVIAELVGRVALLAATAFVAWQAPTVPWVIAAVAFGALVNLGVSFWFSRALVRIRLQLDRARMWVFVREGWPVALSVAFNLIYFKADTLILAATHPASDVGLYGQAYKVLEVLITFPAMLAGLLTPILATAFAQKNIERFSFVLSRAVHGLALLAFPLAVGTPFIAREIMELTGGPAFVNAAPALTTLMLATAAIFFGNLFANTVVAVGAQRKMLWGYAAVAVGALAAYLLTIPQHGMMAAAVVRVASEFAITGVAVALVLRVSGATVRLAILGRVVLACAAMAVALWATSAWGLLPQLGSAAMVYVGALFALRAIPHELLNTLPERFRYAHRD